MSEDDPRRARVEELLQAARKLADARTHASQRLRRRLQDTTGLSRASVDFALERCLEQQVSERELTLLLSRTPLSERALVLLSANVFVAPLRAIVIARAASEQVIVRASRRDPALAEALAELVPRAFELTSELRPRSGDHVWAYGADETLLRVRSGLPEGVVFHPHGFGLGAVVVEAVTLGSELSGVARAIALDASLFDQRGCLSPRLVCVLGEERAARALALELARELLRLTQTLPLAARSREQQAERRRFLDAASYAFEVTPAGECFVSLALDSRMSLPPTGRNLHVARVGDPVAALSPFAPHLTCLALRCSGELRQRLSAAFPGARVCEPGQMQTPPLDGPVDLRSYPRTPSAMITRASLEKLH